MVDHVFHPFSQDSKPEGVIGGEVRHHAERLPGGVSHPRLVPCAEGEAADRFREAAQGRELVIEVGPGKGLFLNRMASAHPDRLFLGVDIRLGFCLRTLERADAARLENIWLAYGDARLMIPALVADASAVEAYLLFPDPWWKRRHARRRHGGLMAQVIGNALMPGGRLVLKSDIEGYLATICESFGASPVFTPHDVPSGLPRTDREDRLVPAGVPIFTAAFVKR